MEKNSPKLSEREEQEICISCGFCCDNTLFEAAHLEEDEEVFGEFTKRVTRIKDHKYFKLPCPYFDEKCTIYDQNKPKVCSSFKCKLLVQAITGEVSKDAALKTIREVKKERDEIIELFLNETGRKESFRTIFHFINNDDNSIDDNPKLRIIKMKAHLLNIQISRHFKTKEMFNDYYEIID